MSSQHPIGIFDSGIGGTSIWKEITTLLPHEHTIYLADSRYAPYGQRTQEEIVALSKKNTEQLLKLQCKLIVVACNTATTNAITELRTQYDVPFVGIEPAIKPAALSTKTNTIGVLATQGTLSSSLFAQTSELYAKDTVEIIDIVGKGLVTLIEAGKIDSMEMRSALEACVKPMIEKEIDHLVLGCTHYPYLIPLLQELLPPTITIIDAGPAVARHTQTLLKQHHLINANTSLPTHQLFSNLQDTSVLSSLIQPIPLNASVAYLDF